MTPDAEDVDRFFDGLTAVYRAEPTPALPSHLVVFEAMRKLAIDGLALRLKGAQDGERIARLELEACKAGLNAALEAVRHVEHSSGQIFAHAILVCKAEHVLAALKEQTQGDASGG